MTPIPLDWRSIPANLVTGRLVLAGLIVAAPVPGLRALGTDTGTARRVSWLTRMLAARDAAIAVGGLVSLRRTGSARPWILAGAASDAVDAAAIAIALRRRQLGGPLAPLTVALAGGSAVAGFASASRGPRA